MVIALRTEEGGPLSWEQVDSNFSSLVYSGSISGSNLVLEYYQGGEFTRDNLVLPIVSSSYAVSSSRAVTASYTVTSSIATSITGSAGYVPYFTGNNSQQNSLIYQVADDSIGIGTDTPEASALLDLSSDRRGFLPPRVTTSEMNTIGSPVDGLMVFNRTEKKIAVYVDGSWRLLAFV